MSSIAEITRWQRKIPNYARNQKIIRADTRNKKKEAVKEAFARHTNWAKHGQ